ncbi:MAG: hypothetical protein LQ351_007945 [Letrouitia transgressa]|nr:MAG: hypothetical protein LQ351_007945 [Letrouitia transgressa]
MEHLPRPKRAENYESAVVPYTAVLYDGGPFMTYPLRVGRPHVLPSYAESNNLMAYWRHEKRHPTPTPELESFIQTWLFFGLLHEILGEICQPSDFIKSLDNSHEPAITISNNDRQEATQVRNKIGDGVLDDLGAKKMYAITTAKLPALLKSWVQKVQLKAIVANYDHIAQCLDLAYQTLRAVGPTFNVILKISIASTAEAIAFATNKAFDITDYIKNNKCTIHWRLLLDLTPWKPTLIANGWCPSQVILLLQSSLSLHSMSLFLHVELQDPTKCHDKCTENGCTAYQNQLECYQTKHVDDHCSCQELTVDSHLTDSIIQNGALPVLRIIENNALSDIEVKVLSTKTSSRYLAISHVW